MRIAFFSSNDDTHLTVVSAITFERKKYMNIQILLRPQKLCLMFSFLSLQTDPLQHKLLMRAQVTS